ncbi:MFS transporter [Actinospica sp. MGRD01-02]|uniref:MFS transporter n=1 Tax=Actinospica acidithermotolerans TaxID=2828514 RepID=A0A941EKB3_9ACTN|nr:MFS transporter [Actinospica acidithermotolerans]MBR7830664.1 MFS transporter [Actinospica acidithermotolerans]
MKTAARPRLALLIVTLAFATMLLSANLATPLYAVYARRFEFSTIVLALVFAVYALVLIPALLMFGQISDRLGRRPAIALGLGLAVAGLLLFAIADSAAWLFAARGTLGVAQGMLSGAATAALAELASDRARRAALLATLAQVGGSAAGVLLCGVLAQWAPWPTVLPFVVGMAVCLFEGIALWSVPETVGDRGGGGLHIRTPRVPPAIRAPFLRVGLTGAVAWAVAAGLFLSVMPSYAGELVVRTSNLALLALLTSVVLLSSFAVQLLLRNGAPPAGTQATGLVLLAVGLATLVVASPTHSMALLIVGATLAGTGHGAACLAAQDELTRIAPADQRAEVSAAFYVCVYLGVSLPVIGIGILADLTTLFTSVATFATVTGACSLALAAWHLRGAAAESSTESNQPHEIDEHEWARIDFTRGDFTRGEVR